MSILVATGCSLQKLIEYAIIVCLNSHLYCLFESLSAYFSGYDGQFAFADIGQGTVNNLIYCDQNTLVNDISNMPSHNCHPFQVVTNEIYHLQHY